MINQRLLSFSKRFLFPKYFSLLDLEINGIFTLSRLCLAVKWGGSLECKLEKGWDGDAGSITRDFQGRIRRKILTGQVPKMLQVHTQVGS